MPLFPSSSTSSTDMPLRAANLATARAHGGLADPAFAGDDHDRAMGAQSSDVHVNPYIHWGYIPTVVAAERRSPAGAERSGGVTLRAIPEQASPRRMFCRDHRPRQPV